MPESLNPQSGKNRRISARRIAKSGVRIACRKGSLGLGKDIASGFHDLSETGIRLALIEALQRGQEVEVTLCALGGKEFKIAGTVAWATETADQGVYRAGIRFDKRIPYATLLDLTKLPEQV